MDGAVSSIAFGISFGYVEATPDTRHQCTLALVVNFAVTKITRLQVRKHLRPVTSPDRDVMEIGVFLVEIFISSVPQLNSEAFCLCAVWKLYTAKKNHCREPNIIQPYFRYHILAGTVELASPLPTEVEVWIKKTY